MSQRHRALVVGATGIAGRHVAQELARRDNWEVVALSRRPLDISGDAQRVSVDLLDPAALASALKGAGEITHVFHCAYVERPTWRELVAPNVAMLANVLDALEPWDSLRHVNLMEGTKWYGSHLGPFRTPAREDDPRHLPPNFYYDQQDLLESRAQQGGWTWSAARPHGICGYADGNAMNLVMVVAVYATILRELGLPLRHPGTSGNADALYNVTEAGLLAKACAWMATEPSAAGEAFNITNGDMFRWRDMWTVVARHFDMELAEPRKIDLIDVMADKAPLWDSIRAKYGLKETPFDRVVAWGYGNAVFGPEYDIVSSTIKARQHGFQECRDSEAMFRDQLRQLSLDRVIP